MDVIRMNVTSESIRHTHYEIKCFQKPFILQQVVIRTWVVLTFRMVVVWADVLPKVYRVVATPIL